MILLPQRPIASLAPNEPGTFPALMELYESNYINMRRLVPTMPRAPVSLISQIPGSLDLHFRLIERFRYTSELNLTYQFKQNDSAYVEPDLRIRVYHDARLAEVVVAHRRHFPIFDAESLAVQRMASAQLYWRWKMNRFLFKWLNYCLRQGYRFEETAHQANGRSFNFS